MQTIKRWENLLNKYYEEKENELLNLKRYEELRKEFEDLNITVPKINFVKADKTCAYVCPDLEGEFPNVYILEDKNIGVYEETIAEAYFEYYKHSSFYDEIAGFVAEDLVRFSIADYNIPVVAHYDCPKTNMLNVRAMNRIAE